LSVVYLYYCHRAKTHMQSNNKYIYIYKSPASKYVNTEAEEATTFEAVTRRQPVKIHPIEKALYAL
jgi:hypothetical protein